MTWRTNKLNMGGDWHELGREELASNFSHCWNVFGDDFGDKIAMAGATWTNADSTK